MQLGNWTTQKELGRGGQGITYLAENTIVIYSLMDMISNTIKSLSSAVSVQDVQSQARRLAEAIRSFSSAIDGTGVAALKVLHEQIRQDSKAVSRLAQEIEILKKNSHPNILQIVDSSVSSGWFATTYYPKGTLADNLAFFAGRPVAALEAIRPLVAAVTVLHRQNIIHRDIKPHNIFYSTEGLVLGDFGLVFFADEARTRLSEKYENVGSRDWMPPWAYGRRVEEIKPSFDVFSLGKVLWAMLSGKTILPLWYHRRKEFDLTVLHPKEPNMNAINVLLDQCLTENEDDVGLPSAVEFLDAIDSLLAIMNKGGDLLYAKGKRACQVCGYGTYEVIVDELTHPGQAADVWLARTSKLQFRIFRCNNCGNLQMFDLKEKPAAWGIL